jgi:uncharacterized protein (DUF2267 family)
MASNLVDDVGEALAECVSAGEIEAMRGQLPIDLKTMFPPGPVCI